MSQSTRGEKYPLDNLCFDLITITYFSKSMGCNSTPYSGFPQCFKQTVHAVSRHSENRVYAPIHQPTYNPIGYRLRRN